jgi:hypothetical protein
MRDVDADQAAVLVVVEETLPATAVAEHVGSELEEKLRLLSEAQRGAVRRYPRAVDAPRRPRA